MKEKMKASELIQKLQKAIEKYGDLPVFENICVDVHYDEWEVQYATDVVLGSDSDEEDQQGNMLGIVWERLNLEEEEGEL